MSALFLGVDGGQSRTTTLIADATGRVLGKGVAGPCNHVGGPEGREKFLRAIEDSLTAACHAAGLKREGARFLAACLGFSGGPADKEAILARILAAERMVVTTDAVIALSGALAGAPGIITIAGTGSIAYGRNGEGQTARAGGWGYIFGDEGGGFDLTRQALRAALRMEEGWGPPTALRALLLEAAGASNANTLLHAFYTRDYPRPRIASFSKLVDQAAIAGDAVAREILGQAAQHLASYTAAVRRQLFAPSSAVTVAYIGGVFRSALLLERFRLLAELEPGVQVRPPQYGPAAGALIEALKAAGIQAPLTQVPESEK